MKLTDMLKPIILTNIHLLILAFLCTYCNASAQQGNSVKPNPDFFTQLKAIGIDKKLHDKLTNDKTDDLSIIYANTRFKFTDRQGTVSEKTGYAQLTAKEKNIVGTNPMEGADYLEFSEEPMIYHKFEGGTINFSKYVNENFQNPFKIKTGGKIILYYDLTINADGSVSDIKIDILGGIQDKKTEEALPLIKKELTRVISASAPLWTPAQKNGVPISLKVGIPFMLEVAI